MKKLALIATLSLAACTNGGIPAPSGGSGGITINVSLTNYQPQKTPYGESGGFSPAITTVAVGTQIHFVNNDSFAHTATAIPNASSFPSGSPFGLSALQQKGTTLSGGFTSGALQPNGSSQTITADRAGTYLFGCFFHYGAPMRAAIVAQ
jgi:plastocyanin